MTVVINGTTGITAPGTETFGSGTALGGATNPIVSMAQGASGYVQSYIINNTNGTSSSADIVAYPSNGADSHGWVDIGITSLSYADTTYTVTGPNESYLFGSAPSGSSTTGNLVIATDNTGTANSIQFYTNGFTQAKSAAKMVIDGSTGNVGIGTTSPTIKLDVTGEIRSYGSVNYIKVERSSSDSAAFISKTTLGNFGSGTGIGVAANCWNVYDYTASAERMRIDSSGNVGIGSTPSGTYKLEVNGSVYGSGFSAVGNATFNRGSGTAYNVAGGVKFQVDGTTYAAIAQPSAMALAFYTGNDTTERARIDSSGNLIVGASAIPSTVSNTAVVSAGRYYSATGSGALSTGTSATLFAIGTDATYIVTAQTQNASGLASVAIVSRMSGGNPPIVTVIQSSSGNFYVGYSGTNATLTNNLGGLIGYQWTAVRIF